MKRLIISRCPETVICSIVKENGTKVDLIPTEVAELKRAGGDPEKIRAVVAESDSQFAGALDADEINEIAASFL